MTLKVSKGFYFIMCLARFVIFEKSLPWLFLMALHNADGHS